MSPRLKSTCSRSSNSRIVRMVRYAARSRSRSSGGFVSAMDYPLGWLWCAAVAAQEPAARGQPHAAGDVDAAKRVASQRDREPVPRGQLDLTFTVQGEHPAVVVDGHRV